MPPVQQPALEQFLYFEYGSNMLNERLLARTPSARVHRTGELGACDALSNVFRVVSLKSSGVSPCLLFQT